MASTGESLNDVDLVAVAGITERYRQTPDFGHTYFAAIVDWLGGYRTEVRRGAFETVRGDEPEELAGSGTGPAPEEMLLGAVAQCLIVGIAGTASARGIGIRHLSVDAGGKRQPVSGLRHREGQPWLSSDRTDGPPGSGRRTRGLTADR